MCKNILKQYIVLFIAVILLSSCSGESCIEADDFGEYDTDVITVDSYNSTCAWVDDGKYGSDTGVISQCLYGSAIAKDSNGKGIVIFKPTDNTCSVTNDRGDYTLKFAAEDKACNSYILRECYMDNTACNDIEFYNSKGEELTSEEKSKYANEAFNSIVQQCRDGCAEYVASYEPGWVSSNIKGDDSAIGIKITDSAVITIQALGSLSLKDAESEETGYNVKNAGIQYDNYIINNSSGFKLSGNWCTYGENCEEDLLYGERSENIIQREEFLRRGVIILKDIPANYTSSNKTSGNVNDSTGPETLVDFSNWKCGTNSTTLGCSSLYGTDGYPMCCSVDSTTSPIEDTFLKTIGGEIIPNLTTEDNVSIKDLIISNPFEKIVYDPAATSLSENTNVETDKYDLLGNYAIVYRGDGESSNALSNGTTKGLILPLQDDTGYPATVDNWKFIYPSKIAFRFLRSKDKSFDTTKKCKIYLEVSGSDGNNKLAYNMEVPVNQEWHFLKNNNQQKLTNSGIIFNDNNSAILNGNFNTLQVDDTYENPDLSKNFSVKIYFDNTTNSEYDCANDLAVMLVPQNEILIGTSGFIDFANLFPATTVSCSEKQNIKCVSNNSNLPITFTIINPLYDFKEAEKCYTSMSSKCNSIIRDNFYEYHSITPESAERDEIYTINNTKLDGVKLNDNSFTNNKIFVRKGQVLRFDDSIWFDYDNGNIRRKTRPNSYTSTSGNSGIIYETSVVDGLVMKIVDRPALMCRGRAEDVVSTTSCDLVKISYTDTTGNKQEKQVCKISHSDVCNDSTNKDNYCPTGCYGEVFSDPTTTDTDSTDTDSSNSSGKTCEYDDSSFTAGADEDDIGDFESQFSEEKCAKCRESIIEEYEKKYATDCKKEGEGNNQKCNITISSGDSNQLLETKANVIQCYDLEGYTGAVSNLFNLNSYGSDTADNNFGYGPNDDVSNYGELNKLDVELGATKLSSIFDTDKNYGNLSGMTFTQNKDDLYYNSSDVLNVSGQKLLGFLVIDNADFTNNVASTETNTQYAEGGFGNYTGNPSPSDEKENNLYYFTFSSKEQFYNGNKMNVALGVSGFGGDDTCLVQWLTKYDENGELDEGNTLYDFDSGGIYRPLASKWTNPGVNIADLIENGYINSGDTVSLKASCNGAKTAKFEELKVFFKVADPEGKTGAQQDTNLYCCPLTNCTEEGCSGIVSDIYNRCSVDTSDIETIEDAKNKLENLMCTKTNTTTNCWSESEPVDGCFLKGKDDEGNTTLEDKLETITVKENVNGYSNNSGSYTIKLQTPKDVLNSTGYIVKYVMEPILEILDGKTVGVALNNSGNFRKCSEGTSYALGVSTSQCASLADDDFGEACQPSSSTCYLKCDAELEKDDVTISRCDTVNDGSGFLENFYVAVITDAGYQIILKLCFTLMICFYGLYYLLGMVDLTHNELIRRVIKIAFIYLMVGEDGWYYYNMFFVKFFKAGVDYLVFAIAGAFDETNNINAMFAKSGFYDKSILFSGVDKNLSLIFSDPVSYKIWGLFFVSFFGWLYVFIIYFSVFSYIVAVANALLLYLTAQFFISMLLALGPIFFVMLVFNKTKEMFDKWINLLISFSLEQIFLLTCLSLFNMLVYNIIKFVLSYRVCWTSVWVLNIPILGSIELMKFWKATSATSTAAAASVPGLFQILLIYLIADIMKNFIKFSSTIATDLGGGGISASGLSSGISSAAGSFFNDHVKKPLKKATKQMGATVARKTIGYKTEADEKQMKERNRQMIKGLIGANRAGTKAIREAKRSGEYDNLTTEERNKKFAEIRDEAVNKYIDNNAELKKVMSEKGITREEFKQGNAWKLTEGTSIAGLAGSALAGQIGYTRSSDKMTSLVKEGKAMVNKRGAIDATKARNREIDREIAQEKAQNISDHGWFVGNLKNFFVTNTKGGLLKFKNTTRGAAGAIGVAFGSHAPYKKQEEQEYAKLLRDNNMKEGNSLEDVARNSEFNHFTDANGNEVTWDKMTNKEKKAQREKYIAKQNLLKQQAMDKALRGYNDSVLGIDSDESKARKDFKENNAGYEAEMKQNRDRFNSEQKSIDSGRKNDLKKLESDKKNEQKELAQNQKNRNKELDKNHKEVNKNLSEIYKDQRNSIKKDFKEGKITKSDYKNQLKESKKNEKIDKKTYDDQYENDKKINKHLSDMENREFENKYKDKEDSINNKYNEQQDTLDDDMNRIATKHFGTAEEKEQIKQEDLAAEAKINEEQLNGASSEDSPGEDKKDEETNKNKSNEPSYMDNMDDDLKDSDEW